MQRARRSAIPSWCSISASIRTPASEVSRPPSNATRTTLPAIAGEPNRTKAPSAAAIAAPRPCRYGLGRDRLRPSGRARPIGGTGVDVEDWVRGLGLERYEQAFRDNDIDADVLPELTADDLTGLGITSVGHRRKLLAAIAALRSGPAPSGVAAEPSIDAPPAMPSTEAERRQLTVMFVALVGSTALATRVDPEDLREVVGAYHRRVAAGIERFGGFVAKYM